MPTSIVRTADGSSYKVTHIEGATKEQIEQAMREKLGWEEPPVEPPVELPEDPALDVNLFEGSGAGYTDLGYAGDAISSDKPFSGSQFNSATGLYEGFSPAGEVSPIPIDAVTKGETLPFDNLFSLGENLQRSLDTIKPTEETPRIPSSMTQAEVEEYLSSAKSEQDLQNRFKTLENMLQLEDQEEAMPLSSYIEEGIKDVTKAYGEGGIRGLGYTSDAFEVDDNPVSDWLESGAESSLLERSAGSQLDAIRMQQIMEAADREYAASPDIDPDEEGKQTSWGAKAKIAKEYIRAGSYSPLELASESLGISTPIMLASMINPMAGIAVAGTMGAGLARRNIYDAVYSSLIEARVNEADARRVAKDSASYFNYDDSKSFGENIDGILRGDQFGQNLDQIVFSSLAMVGATTLPFGVEAVIRSSIARKLSQSVASKVHIPSIKAQAAKAPAQQTLNEVAREVSRSGGINAAKEIGKGIIREAPAEFVQGGQEAYAIDLALQRLGTIGFSFVDGIPYYQGKPFGQYPKEIQDSLRKEIIKLAKTDPWGRVWGQAAMEGVLGAGMGATFGVPAARAQLKQSAEIAKALDELETGGTDIDPLRDVDVTEEQEAKLRQQEEARRQRAAIPRKEEDVTSRLDGDDAIDMLSDDEADPLKLELTDPSKEREVLSQDVGELIESLPKSDTEGSLPDGSPKIQVVNQAVEDVIKVVKQGHTLEYSPKQEAQRKAIEEVMGEEAASLYEKTVKERMSYVNSLRRKSSSEMLKNWAKRAAKTISRGLKTHFPQNETFSIEQRGQEIVVVDKSGKVYGKFSTANRDPNEAFELGIGLAGELNVESKRRADEWKRTGQPYDPVDTIRALGLPKKPKKKNYKNPKYTERQYRVASVMSKVTGDMPARIELEGRSSPMSDKAFEDLTKRINDEAAQRLQEQAQEPETPPLRLEEDKFRKKIRSKIKKVLSGRGLDNIGVVLADELFDVKFDEDGNPIVDLSEEARRRVTKEGAKDPIGAYKKGPKNAEVIALALKAISESLGKNPTKKQIIEEILNVLNHETVHALRINDLFTENEWKLLSKLAANRKDTPYRMTYLERSRKMNPELAAQGEEDLLNEEAIAEMIKDGLRTDENGNPVLRTNWGGKPRSLFNRVYEFFKRLLGLRKDIGFETFDAILTGIEEGAIGSRERGVIRTRRAALRVEDKKEAKRRSNKTNDTSLNEEMKEVTFTTKDGREIPAQDIIDKANRDVESQGGLTHSVNDIAKAIGQNWGEEAQKLYEAVAKNKSDNLINARLESPETIPDESEAGEAPKTVLDEIEDALERKEDFPEDYLEADPIPDEPAFARRPIETIENQIKASEAKLYRLNSEMRNDGPNYTAKKATQKSREIQKEEELLADLNAELELNQLRSESVFPDDVGEISYARGPQKPKKTRKAYKLFKVGRAKAGPNKGQPALFPLYIAQKSMPNGLPIGEWMRAEMGESARDDEGNIVRDSKGRIKVKSLIGRLAFRPGWHAAILPFARHIGNKITNGIFDNTLKSPTSRKPNEVWAEVEFGVDKDYSAELERQGGEIRDRVPMLGSYEFNTNNAAEGMWLIGGDMKINKILSDEEVEAINKEAGSYDLPRLRPKTKYVQRIQDMEAERSYEKSLDDPASFARRLTGMPESYTVDGQSVEFGFFEPALNVAEEYAAESGIDYSGMENFAPLDPERASKIAVEFELMRHAPDDPLVKAAYNALVDETNAQFRKMLDTGLTVRFIKGEDPYGNPRNAILDVINNNNMFVFSTRDGFGSDDEVAESLKDNPLLQETEFVTADGEPMLANDVFRAVHDYFGHIKDGVGFRARGEENAWQSHAAMYSPLARQALTTETRGQNSWVNYGPHGEFNRTASPAETIYADQKIGLLPLWVSLEGRLSDERYKSDAVGERYTDGLQGAIGSDGLLELSHYSNNKVYRNQPKLAGTGADKWTNNRPEKATWFGIVKADEDGFRIEKDKAVSSTHENIFKVDPKLLYRWYDPNLDTTKMENDPEGLIVRWPAGNLNFEKTFENLNNAGYIGFWANQKSGYGKYAVINTPLLSQDYTDKVNYDTLRELAELDDDIAFSRPIKLTGFPDEFRGDRRRSFLSASEELDILTQDQEVQYDDEGNVIVYKQDDPSTYPPRYLEGEPKLKKKGKQERLKSLAKQKDFLELPYDEGLKRYMELVKRARKQGFNVDIIFYHGTMSTQPIRKFDPRKGDTREEEGMKTGREKQIGLGRQVAAHFTYDLGWAEDWSIRELARHRDKGRPQVYPVYLRLENMFDSRNPEGLLTKLNIDQAMEDAYNEIYEKNSFSKESLISKMGTSFRRIKELENTKAFRNFVEKMAANSKVAQSLRKNPYVLPPEMSVMDALTDNAGKLLPFDPFAEDKDTNAVKVWYRAYAMEPFNTPVGVNFVGGFMNPRVEIKKNTLPKIPTNPLNRTAISHGTTFKSMETISFAIHDAGFGGYVDFENPDGRPNGVGIYNGKDIKGIFADFKPEAVPEGMDYEDDIMFSRGFNDRVQTSIPFRRRTIKGVVQPIEFTIGDAEDFIIGLDRARQDPKGVLIGKLAKATRNYNFLSEEIKALDDEAVLDAFKQHMIDNLIYLYNEMSPEVREIAKRWYDGARKLSDTWAQRYEIEPRQVAAVIANLSPQKDWFMNMSLAERLLDIMSYRQDYEADKAMNDAFKRIVLYTEKGKRILAKDLTKEAKTSKSIWSKIKDKKLSEVKDAVPIRQINLAEAIWVRMYDEAHNPRAYRKMSPDGNILDFQRKQNGEKADVAWGSFTEIAKGVIAAKTPDLEKISISLGKMHKVRNFYNNIIAPDSELGEVTIDTHAVAAALLKPLSAKSYEVAHNFGSTPKKEVLGMPENVKREGAGGSGVAGSLGTYPVIADAYRDAASQLGILPRQLQSITWEQVRTLFPASFKDEEGNNLAKINKLWDNYASGDISLSDLREEIYGYTKTRRNKPTWATRSDAGSDVSRGAETYDRQLSSRELPRQGRRRLEERSRGDVDDTPPAYSRRPRDLATPEQLEENAAEVLAVAEKSQGKYVPRVNVNASLEAKYIANNPDVVVALDESDLAYYSRRDQDQPVEIAKAVDQATGEKQKRESPAQTFFRLLDLNAGERFRYRIDQFREAMIGQHERLARYHLLSEKLYKHLADVSSIDAAMLAERAMNFVGQTLTSGVITYNLNNNGTTKVVPFTLDGKEIGGLLDVHGKLFRNPKTNPYGDLTREAQTYAILKRIERLKSEGKPVPKIDVTLAEFEKGIEKYVDPTTGENILRRWHKEWSAFNEFTIKFMEDTGILDEETSKLWRDYSDYIPFYREAEIDGDAIPSNYKTLDQKVFGGMAKIPKLVQLKGSDKRVDIPLLEATYNNLAAAIQMGMKNVAAQRIARDMLELGIARKAPPSVTEKEAYIAEFKVKGKRVRYEILDPLIYQSMLGSNISLPTWFRNIFGVPANLLREMITKAATFMVNNIWRDSGSAFVTSSSERFVPVLGAIVNLAKSTKDLERLGVVGGFQMDLTRGDDLDQQVRKLMRRQGLYAEGEGPTVWEQFMNIWDKLEVATNRSESVVRRQVYDSVMSRIGNEAEAQKEAIEVLNFARHGNNPILRMWATANPFFNARIQGLDRTYKAHRGTTRPADRRSQKAAVASTFINSSILLATTILYYMMVRDEEWYEELREDQKYLRYYFPNEGGRPFTLPIMFEIGLLYKSIPEAIMRRLDDKTTSKEALTHMGRQVKETFKVDPFGMQTFKPLIEVARNKDSFTGLEIEPYYMQKSKSPLFRKKPSTNLLAVETAEALDEIGVKISPLQVEHLMTGYGGTIGTWGISAVDRVLRSELVAGDKTLVKPAEDFRDGIIAKTFFGKREGSGYVNRFYEMSKYTDQIVGNIDEALKEGDAEEYEKRIAGRRGIYLAGKTPPVEGMANVKTVKKYLQDIRNMEKVIYSSDISAQEKQRKLDIIRKHRNDYLADTLPRIQKEYGFDLVPLIDPTYVTDPERIAEDRK